MDNRAFRLSGQISDFPLMDVIQFLGMTRKTGELRIFNGKADSWASLYFQDELLVHAQWEQYAGVEAFLKILSRDNGHFHFFSGQTPSDRSINKPVHYLMLQLQSELDEMRNLQKILPPSDTVLIISSLVDSVPKLNSREWLILSQINGRRTLGQIVARSGEELSTRKILHRLFSERLIAPLSEKMNLSRLVPGPLDSDQSGADRPYPPRLRTNLLLKEIDGKRDLLEIAGFLNLKERDLIEDVKLLLDSKWITFAGDEQLQTFLSIYEEG